VGRILLSGELIGSQINAASWPQINEHIPDSCFYLAISSFNFSDRDHHRIRIKGEGSRGDEYLQLNLIKFVGDLRIAGGDEFRVHAARICARSIETNKSMVFGAGDSFQSVVNLNNILDEFQRSSISVSYDWSESGSDFREMRRQQRIPFVGELVVTPCNGDSILGERWREIVGPTLVPFEVKERQALLEKVRGIADMAKRIDKWKRHPGNLRW